MSEFAKKVASFSEAHFEKRGYFPNEGGGSYSGGGGGDMFEARIQRLESDVREVRTDVKEIRDRTSRIEAKLGLVEGKLSALPGYPGLLVVATVIIGAITLVIKFMPPNIPQ